MRSEWKDKTKPNLFVLFNALKLLSGRKTAAFFPVQEAAEASGLPHKQHEMKPRSPRREAPVQQNVLNSEAAEGSKRAFWRHVRAFCRAAEAFPWLTLVLAELPSPSWRRRRETAAAGDSHVLHLPIGEWEEAAAAMRPRERAANAIVGVLGRRQKMATATVETPNPPLAHQQKRVYIT